MVKKKDDPERDSSRNSAGCGQRVVAVILGVGALIQAVEAALDIIQRFVG